MSGGGEPGPWSGRHPDELLSLLVDDDLAGKEAALVEAHLGECPRCREVASDLERIVARAGRLPDRRPEEDLWPGIAGRIRDAAGEEPAAEDGGSTAEGHRPAPGDGEEPEEGGDAVTSLFGREVRVSVPRLAAAAALVAAMASGVTWSLTRAGGEGPPGASGPVAAADTGVPGTAGVPEGARWAALDASPVGLRELEASYREARDELEPETRRMLERNLRLVDRAVEEARRALTENPRDAYLHRQLARTVHRKAELLSVAVRMSDRS